MSKTIFKIGLYTNSEQDFTIFSSLCNSIADLDITLRILAPGKLITIDKRFFETPVYIIHHSFFDDPEFKETLGKIKETNAPILCLLDNSNITHTRSALKFAGDFWLYSDILNSPILQSTLIRAEQIFRLKVESQYLKKKFHESEKRFLSVIRSKQEAVIVIDQNNMIRFINPVCEQKFGVPRTYIGQPFPYILKAGQIREIDLKPFSGKTEIVEAIVNDLFWENELCLTVSLHDTSEMRRVQNDLVTFRHVIHLSPMPIIITDNKGEILYVNEMFSKYTGYSSEEAIGNTPRLLKSGRHDQAFYKNIWETILKGETWRGQICNKTKEGKLYWEKKLISPVTNNKNEIMFFVSIRIDDLEQKKAEKAKQKADTLKSVQELAGGIAHEFSQPLQVLSISMALLEKEIGNSEYFQKANKMIKRIIKLVDNLKSITTLRQQDYLSSKILDIKASSDKALLDIKANRILIIDDEKEVLESLLEILTLTGYACEGATNGLDALQAIEDKHFKLIVCDIDMPGIPGTELFKKIKETGYSGYFVFMTGYEVDEDLDDVVKQADGFLTKPFQLNELKKFVNKIFDEDDQIAHKK
jgi:PAS domain S-box-containing protein